LSSKEIENITTCKPEAIELALLKIRAAIFDVKKNGGPRPATSVSPKLPGREKPVNVLTKNQPIFPPQRAVQREVTKDDIIFQLKDTIEATEAKMNKLHQILNVLDQKIATLEERGDRLGI